MILYQGLADNHEQRGGYALARYIRHDDGEVAFIHHEEIIEVTANLLGGGHAGVDINFLHHREYAGQHAGLDVGGDIEFGFDLLLGHAVLHLLFQQAAGTAREHGDDDRQSHKDHGAGKGIKQQILIELADRKVGEAVLDGLLADCGEGADEVGVPFAYKRACELGKPHRHDGGQQGADGELPGIIVAGQDDGSGPGKDGVLGNRGGQHEDACDAAGHDINLQPGRIAVAEAEDQAGQQEGNHTAGSGNVHNGYRHLKQTDYIQQPDQRHDACQYAHAFYDILIGLFLVFYEGVGVFVVCHSRPSRKRINLSILFYGLIVQKERPFVNYGEGASGAFRAIRQAEWNFAWEC